MDKMKFSEYLRTVMLDSTAKQRDLLCAPTDPAIPAIKAYFGKGDLRTSDVRLKALKELFADMGVAGKIDHINLADLQQAKVEAVRFCVMRVLGNPNSHNYAENYFVVGRPAQGFKQNGEIGNCFPSSDTPGATWQVASEDKVIEMAAKYVDLAKRESDFREFVLASVPLLSSFVDFSEVL